MENRRKKEKTKIWLATTNKFKTGGNDEYKLMAEIPLEKEQFNLDISNIPSDFYKIVIETPTNIMNRWVVSSDAKKPL